MDDFVYIVLGYLHKTSCYGHLTMKGIKNMNITILTLIVELMKVIFMSLICMIMVSRHHLHNQTR